MSAKDGGEREASDIMAWYTCASAGVEMHGMGCCAAVVTRSIHRRMYDWNNLTFPDSAMFRGIHPIIDQWSI